MCNIIKFEPKVSTFGAPTPKKKPDRPPVCRHCIERQGFTLIPFYLPDVLGETGTSCVQAVYEFAAQLDASQRFIFGYLFEEANRNLEEVGK